jgi:hypothetical protein
MFVIQAICAEYTQGGGLLPLQFLTFTKMFGILTCGGSKPPPCVEIINVFMFWEKYKEEADHAGY